MRYEYDTYIDWDMTEDLLLEVIHKKTEEGYRVHTLERLWTPIEAVDEPCERITILFEREVADGPAKD